MEGAPLGWGRQEVDGWRKGPWTSQEDKLLVEHVRQHGEGRWNSVSKLTGTLAAADFKSKLNPPPRSLLLV